MILAPCQLYFQNFVTLITCRNDPEKFFQVYFAILLIWGGNVRTQHGLPSRKIFIFYFFLIYFNIPEQFSTERQVVGRNCRDFHTHIPTGVWDGRDATSLLHVQFTIAQLMGQHKDNLPRRVYDKEVSKYNPKVGWVKLKSFVKPPPP